MQHVQWFQHSTFRLHGKMHVANAGSHFCKRTWTGAGLINVWMRFHPLSYPSEDIYTARSLCVHSHCVLKQRAWLRPCWDFAVCQTKREENPRWKVRHSGRSHSNASELRVFSVLQVVCYICDRCNSDFCFRLPNQNSRQTDRHTHTHKAYTIMRLKSGPMKSFFVGHQCQRLTSVHTKRQLPAGPLATEKEKSSSHGDKPVNTRGQLRYAFPSSLCLRYQ